MARVAAETPEAQRAAAARRCQRLFSSDAPRLLGVNGIIGACSSVRRQQQMAEALRNARDAFEAWCGDVEAGSRSMEGYPSLSPALQRMQDCLTAYSAWVGWGWGALYAPTQFDLDKHKAEMRPAWKKWASALSHRLNEMSKDPDLPPTTEVAHPDDDTPDL